MAEDFSEYPALPQSLEHLARLSKEQFDILREAVAEPEGFEAGFARCKKIARSLGDVTAHDVYDILGSLWYLQDRLFELDDEGGEVDSATVIRELFEFLGLEKAVGEGPDDGLYIRVGELIADGPGVAARDEVHRLKTAILDTVVDFDSFVDLRPRFSENSKKVEEFIPIVIFRIGVECDFGPEKSYIFQLTKDGIAALRTVLDNIDNQLAVLSANDALGLRPHVLPTAGKEKADA
jgi:hypothetical protein